MILQAEDGTGSLVLLPAEVVQTLNAFRQDSTEAGGILLGCYRTPHIEIMACTKPLPKDVRSRAEFDRRDPGHQHAAMEHWKASGKTVTFVGEWHTHPEPFPSPSSTDQRTWDYAKKRVTPRDLVFVIRGQMGWWFGKGRHETDDVRLIPIPTVVFDDPAPLGEPTD